MGAALAWFRLDLRRRWRSLLVLALLVAVASGMVMAAAAGATRAASAVDRLLAATLPATVLVTPVTPGFDWDAVRALPEVEALTELVFSPYEVDGRPAPTTMMLPPADAEAMSTIERPVVLDGRLADPTRADEVVVTPAFAADSGKRVGDTVSLRLFTPEQVDAAEIPEEAHTNLTAPVWILTAEQMNNALATGSEIEETQAAPSAPPACRADRRRCLAAGPVVGATIVGIVRSPWFGDRVGTAGFVVPSAGLYAEYEPELLGAEGLASTNALVRLRGGEQAIARFQARLSEITGRPDISVWNLAASTTKMRDVTGFEATGLAVFAAVAGIVATVLIGLAVARHATSTATELQILRAMGMTPRESRGAAALGPGLAAIAGAVTGAAIAIAASRWFPLGSASVVEPTPGVHVDLGVLAAGLIGVPVLIAVTAAVATTLVHRRAASMASDTPSAIASAAAQAGLPVAAVLGTRFALERGSGPRAVPVHPVLVAAVAGITGVMASITVSTAVADATTNPARLGILYQVEAWAGFEGNLFWAAEQGFVAMAGVPGVVGLNDTRAQVADAGGEQITVFSLNPVGTPPDYVVIRGRLPAAPTEILLGVRAARALGAGLGDTVPLVGTSGTAEYVVVGLGFVDFIGMRGTAGAADPAGAVTTEEGYEALFGGDFLIRYGQVALESGADVETMLPLLSEAAGTAPGGAPPPELIVSQESIGDALVPAELRSVRTLPMALAGFLAALASGAVGHALATAVRRRRYDLAVLRAVGMTGRQSHGVVVTQAAVLALVGLVVGVPLGVALGRTAWRYVPDITALHYVPPAVWSSLVLIVPVTLVAAILLAAWPGHRASSLRIASVLRIE